MKIDHLESIFEEGLNVQFRVLQSFFEFLKDSDYQKILVEYISLQLEAISDLSNENLSREESQQIAKTIVWNYNFFVVCILIDKIIHSLGSEKLTSIVASCCDREDSPAAFLVKHGIFMWYNKNLQLDEIVDRIGKSDFSKTAKRIMEKLVVEHCQFHQIDFRDRQKIENKLDISRKHLISLKEREK